MKLWKRNILPFDMDSNRESFRMWFHLIQLFYSSSIRNNYWYIALFLFKADPTLCANTKGKMNFVLFYYVANVFLLMLFNNEDEQAL